jgi:hypothetical protein
VQDFQGDSQAERLSFHGITSKVRAILSDNRDYLLHLLPEALEVLYSHASHHPSLTNLHLSDTQKKMMMAFQLAHWGIILTGRFDADYIASVKKVAELHHRVGLEPRWYIGGYNFLMSALTSIMTTEDHGDDLVVARNDLVVTPILQAITSAVMFDMDCVMEAFMSFREMYLD